MEQCVSMVSKCKRLYSNTSKFENTTSKKSFRRLIYTFTHTHKFKPWIALLLNTRI